MLQGKWPRIGLFYLVALAVSALARLYWHTGAATTPQDGAWAMYRHLIAGAGPALGAAAVVLACKYRSRIGLGGTNPALAAIMVAVPALVMGGMGIANPFGMEPHLFGIHMGLWIAAYAILEEIGWRGYLQDEFRNRPALLKYAIVGLFWYAWHLSWLNGNPVASELVTIVFMVLASIGIGFVADRTGSVLAAAAFHVIGNVMGLTTDFTALIPSAATRGTIALVCVAIWLVVLRIWRSRDVGRGTVHQVRASPVAP